MPRIPLARAFACALALMACTSRKEPADGGSGTRCAPDLSVYTASPYREPDQPAAAPVALTAGPNEIRLRLTFAPEANDAASLTYWLTGDEPMRADVQLALGSLRADYAGRGAYAVLVVDGHQTPFSVDDGPVAELHPFQTPAAGERARFSLQLAGGAITDGAHSAAFLTFTKTAFAVAEWSFTILKNGATFAPRRMATADLGPRGGAPTVDLRRRPGLLSGNLAPDTDGEFKVHLAVQTLGQQCPDLTLGLTVVAFLDGRQVPVSAAVEAPHFELTSAKRAQLDTAFTRMPRDGEVHGLAVYLLGEGDPAEAPPGTVSPWRQLPYLMGYAFWGL